MPDGCRSLRLSFRVSSITIAARDILLLRVVRPGEHEGELLGLSPVQADELRDVGGGEAGGGTTRSSSQSRLAASCPWLLNPRLQQFSLADASETSRIALHAAGGRHDRQDFSVEGWACPLRTSRGPTRS